MDSIFIFSREELFARMLYYELDNKYDVTLAAKPDIKTDGADLIIYDADDTFYTPAADVSAALIAYGVKQRGDYVLSDSALFFHRPFAVSELLYETERILSDVQNDSAATLRFSHKRVYVNNEKIPLTETEYEVLSYLFEHRGELVERDEIKRLISGKENAAASNCADVYISFIRAKIEKPYGYRFIKTVRGKGYTLV